jgi:integrase
MASIRKHGNRQQVRWRVGPDKFDTKSFPDTPEGRREAEAFKLRVEALTVVHGDAPSATAATPDDVMTLAKWWDRWEPGRPWSESSRSTHRLHWSKYIKPVFGAMPIDAIRKSHIEKFHRKLESKKLSPGYVESIHRTLSMALKGAMDDRLITENPARAATLRKVTKVDVEALDPKTLTALLDAIASVKPDLDVFARLISATGLRRAEAAGITWDRVDLDAGTILIDRQLDYAATKSAAVWGPTKNRVTRSVLLSERTVALLRVHRAAQSVVVLDGTGLVFTRPDGRWWPRSTLQLEWTRAEEKLAGDGVVLPATARGWHALRHTFGSRLLEARVPPAEAAEMMGHSIEELLRTYAHVTDRKAADARIRAAIDA